MRETSQAPHGGDDGDGDGGGDTICSVGIAADISDVYNAVKVCPMMMMMMMMMRMMMMMIQFLLTLIILCNILTDCLIFV